ncbi:MAG: hypothetical protein QM396_08835 [Euryarchaeota archaeon]|nr:hypothetical protein [Euryarchaeota archaeon]HHT17975.1 hypothetical protein [Methanobacterium sp.]
MCMDLKVSTILPKGQSLTPTSQSHQNKSFELIDSTDDLILYMNKYNPI